MIFIFTICAVLLSEILVTVQAFFFLEDATNPYYISWFVGFFTPLIDAFVMSFLIFTYFFAYENKILEKNNYISSILNASNEIQIIIDKDKIIIDFSKEAHSIFNNIKKI
jgi:hypothetical protein